jgi:hypothetical protein
MKRILQTLFILALMITSQAKAQQKPTFIGHSEPVKYVRPLINRTLTAPVVQHKEVNPRHNEGRNIIVPGKGLPKGLDPVLQNSNRSLMHPATNPLLTFEATRLGATPSDPTGAVGPNHYVVAYNTGFKIFDKNGNVLVNDTSLSTLFSGYNSDGDPIVLYDQFADRFLITEFDLSSTPNKLLVAVSQTADPVNGGWYIYAFSMNSMPDYPKFSLWSDGYYITANKDSGTASTSEVVFAVERDKMLNGDTSAAIVGFPLPGITTSGFYSPLGFNANGTTPPPSGNAPIIYMQDDSWSGVNQDHLKIWNINVDWNNISNSTITNQPQVINTTAFNSVFNNGSFSNLPQPNGTDIDALQATIMFMANYRRFPSYNSAVINYVVNTDNQGKAGIRWYELRQDSDGQPWYIYQEGTYIDSSNHNTFAGSINMDSRGNIGLGYTIVDSDQVPELRFTGRLSSDPLNQMTIASQAFVPGVSSDPYSRYGDYAQLTVDPTDNKTFWFISEYFSGSNRIDQVGVFKLASDFDNDVGISNITAPVSGVLSANETITVEITNFGLQSQSNIPVQYQINGGNVITENYTGTIAPGASVSFTFSTTADMSSEGADYTITASTALSSDQDNSNDAATITVTHLFANDMGVTEILTPQSATGLTNAENIQVVIKNFGGQSQSNVPVSFTLDGNTVSEVAPGPFAPNSEQNYTFTHTGDFSALGDHQLSAATQLSNDQDSSNDSASAIITNQLCQPSGNCSYGDEITRLQFGSIDNSSSCDTGYQDFTNISTAAQRGVSHDMIITVGYGDEHVTAWIDYNDNYIFETSEIIIDNQIIAPGNSSGSYTDTFSISIPGSAALGEHLMRIRTNWQNAVPDACSDVDYGETEDYKVNIRDDAGIDDVFEGAGILVQTLDENHFKITLETNKIKNDMLLQVFTVGGKEIVFHKLKNKNGKYTYDLNLQFVSKGVYLLKIGNDKGSKIKKIIVQ